ncbi:MAG TPA: cytidylate kinase-like family protein [Burkholderiales bacterium]|nr:cytidylate kinase-like family protein [Burkholderiales bacterium]
MPIIAITREMGSLGKDVARGLGETLGLPVIYHEVIDQLADRLRVRKSHVIRLLDGSAGLLERLTADKTSLSIYTADEIYGLAASCTNKGGAIIRGWGATHLLREIAHVVCVRVCAPFELRKTRMMERLASDDEERVAEEIRANDEAHSAIMRRHFGLQWTEPEHYDVVLNTKRVSVDECVSEVLTLARSPQFEETERSRAKLADLALAARVRAALRRAPETREARVQVSSASGRIMLSGASSTDEMLAFVEVASAVPGVRDVAYRTHPGEELRPRFH